VAHAVRERVLSVAKELRYVPHHGARSLSSRRTHTIGVVLPDLHGEFFSELVRGVDQVAREHDLHLLVSSHHGHPDEQGLAMRAMRGRVDGLLVMSPYVDTSALAEDLASAPPAVLINSRPAPEAAGLLAVDNYGGAWRMVEHLVGQGYRRIAFISGPLDNFDAHERLRGYGDALKALLPDVEPLVLAGEFDESSGHRAGRALLALQQRPDAIFAANDMMALGCLFAMSQAGVSVPDDIALAGFDDIPLARYVHPSLTTMGVDIAALGGRALRMLLGVIGGEAAEVDAGGTLSPELVVRDSTRQSPKVLHRDSS